MENLVGRGSGQWPHVLAFPEMTHVWVTFGLLLVGAIDYLTGIELRLFPLYFLPLMLAALRLTWRSTLLFAVAANVVWACSNYAGGREYSHAHVWLINFVTQGSVFVLVGLLVFHLRSALERERNLSRTDALTGLPNRRGFEEKAEIALALCHRYRHPIVLAFIDLDNFKNANDTLGHGHGDVLLQKLARTLNARLRSTDITARIGGDEFVVMLPETTAEGAQRLFEGMRASLAEDSAFRASAVTLSIGGVAHSLAPQALAKLLEDADKLMYEVKGSTKNRVRVVSS